MVTSGSNYVLNMNKQHSGTYLPMPFEGTGSCSPAHELINASDSLTNSVSNTNLHKKPLHKFIIPTANFETDPVAVRDVKRMRVKKKN